MDAKRLWLVGGIAYQLIIYATLPFTPSFINACSRRLGAGVFGLVFTAFVGVSIALLAVWLALSGRVLKLFLLGIAVTGLFLCKMTPYERFHVVEYALLAFLYKNGTGSRKKAFVLASIGGVLDEVIQWLLPNRYFDLKDILWNVVGAFLGE